MRQPTINDVAREAGVSRSTTARALRGTGYVAAGVRERVTQVADALGYVPNVVASSLRSRASRSIGMLVSDLRDPFYSELAAGVAYGARNAGYTVVLLDSRRSEEEEMEAARTLVSLRVAGVVVTPLTAAVAAFFRAQGVPLIEADRTFGADGSGAEAADGVLAGAVLADAVLANAVLADAVLVDNVGASQRLVDLLLSLGHRRIGMLADETAWTTGAGRFAGYTASLEAAGIPFDPSLVARPGSDVGDARSTAIGVLTQRDRPTAVFCTNSVLAEGLWRAAGDLGLRVPQELSIVAFDDAPWMSLVSPGVTAIGQDTELMGQAAMRRLLARLDDPAAPTERIVLEARLLPRGSTAPPRDA